MTAASLAQTPEEPPRPRHFSAVLHPHRSLSRTGFRRVMIAIVILNIIVGGSFFLAGAWPVIGFLGLDILAVWLALSASYRAGQRYETVELTDDALVVTRVSAAGETRQWKLNPAWLRIRVHRPMDHDGVVLLESHGKAMAIGDFLTAEERSELADAIARAVDDWRRRPAY